jgi:hypothetical protein
VQALEALRGGGADPEWGDLSFCSLRLDGADAKSRKARARPKSARVPGTGAHRDGPGRCVEHAMRTGMLPA